MKIGILAKGGKNIGLGHLGRCVSICQAFKKLCTSSIKFYGLTDESEIWIKNVAPTLESRTFKGEPNLLIVDIGNVLDMHQKAVIERLKPRLILGIHDVGKFEIEANYILNGAVYAAVSNYTHLPEAKTLLGPKFQPLRQEFWSPKKKTISDRITNVVVCLGGGDNVGASIRLYEIARMVFSDAVFNVVVGPYAEAPIGIGDLTIHRSPKNISSLINSCDIAISGAGQILYELAALGIPTVALPIADNQVPNIEYFEKMGLMLMAPKIEDAMFNDVTLEKMFILQSDYERRVSVSLNMQRIVDGRGALRIAKSILSDDRLRWI
jgi:UDP-2,4-diacetamido-2,4,6-trideoxy-beta-L-altropyranose hydrolase